MPIAHFRDAADSCNSSSKTRASFVITYAVGVKLNYTVAKILGNPIWLGHLRQWGNLRESCVDI